MTLVRRIRPFVCLLLAVSTAVGTAVPARTCGCATPAATPPAPAGVRAALSTPAMKSCCQANAKKRACCSSTSTCGSENVVCCDGKARKTGPGHPARAADPPGCLCTRCDCDTPGVPPAPTAPATAIPDVD